MIAAAISNGPAAWGGNVVEGDTQSFVVRIWHEAVDGNGEIIAWRGSIDHVGSARRVYFQDLQEVTRFIVEATGLHQATWAEGERA